MTSLSASPEDAVAEFPHPSFRRDTPGCYWDYNCFAAVLISGYFVQCGSLAYSISLAFKFTGCGLGLGLRLKHRICKKPHYTRMPNFITAKLSRLSMQGYAQNETLLTCCYSVSSYNWAFSCASACLIWISSSFRQSTSTNSTYSSSCSFSLDIQQRQDYVQRCMHCLDMKISVFAA